jgi:transcriptional regulator with XRE-family HTH domain
MAEVALPLIEDLQREIRVSGLSLNELAKRTGVSQPQLWRFMNGQRTLTLPAAARVCEYLGLQLKPGRKSARRDTPSA